MAKKFSLKDNPIFQRLEAPASREPEPPDEEALPIRETPHPPDVRGSSPDGQNVTLRGRPSESTPQDVTSLEPPEPRVHRAATAASVQSYEIVPSVRDMKLRDHLDKSLFFGFFNEMVDDLLPMLDSNEQVLYIRLFRLSYGFNRNYCTVSQSLLIERTGFSRNTVRTSLQSLARKGWIGIVGAGNRVSTTYRVVLPRERPTGPSQSGVIDDPQTLTLNNRPSEFDGHDMSRKPRGSGTDPAEGQNLDLQSQTLSHRPPEDLEKIAAQPRGSNSEGQRLPLLLKTLTNNSLTLQRGERGSSSEPQKLTLTGLTLLARELVDKFYAHLGQRPSKAKRDKSVEECLGLLLEGFAVDEIDYAITWLIQHHPGTGSFSRLAHFVDQAIKDREVEQHAREVEQQQLHEGERQRAERQQMQEERRQIEAVKASLPDKILEALHREATRLVEHESPNLKLGKNLMIQMKLHELVKLRYLP